MIDTETITYTYDSRNGLISTTSIGFGWEHNANMLCCYDAIYGSNYKPFGPGVGETGSEDYRYTGKHEDPSGLYYFGARYYDPLTGRFTTRDTVFGELTNPQSQNKYVYCLNNPQKYVDPDGNNPLLLFAGGLVLMTFGGALKSAEYLQNTKDPTPTGYMNNFLIGFSSTFFDAFGAVTGLIIAFSPLLGAASGSLEHEMEKVGSIAGADGVEDPGLRTPEDVQTNAIANTMADRTGNIVTGITGSDTAGNVVSEVVEPYYEDIINYWSNFTPPESYYWSTDPNNPMFRDPYVWTG